MAKPAFVLSGLLYFLVTSSAFYTPVVGAPFHRVSSRLNANIAVFGGSGKTGSECVYQSLSAGSKPFILSRDSSKLKIPLGSGGKLGGSPLYDPNLKIVVGDVTDAHAVDRVFENNKIDGVIVALGGRTSDVGPTMLTDGTTNIINSMKKFGVKRVSIVTSIGVGDSLSQAPLSFRMLIYTVMRKLFKDKHNQEQLFLSPQGPGRDLE